MCIRDSFNGDSVMQTGWITWKDGTKSFFDWDGKALLGWRSFQGRKCYFDPGTGISRRYSQKIDGAWYYFASDSFMFTGCLLYTSMESDRRLSICCHPMA